MPDANELVDTLKRAAVEAVEAGKPVNVYFGEVVSASPLKINVEQKMILGEKQLILSRNVTDFSTMVTVDWTSESLVCIITTASAWESLIFLFKIAMTISFPLK